MKTKEEIFHKQAEIFHKHLKNKHQWSAHQILEAMEEYAEFKAKEASWEWHPLTDIPEEDKLIIVMNENGDFWTHETEHDDFALSCYGMIKNTHWAYIKSPKS